MQHFWQTIIGHLDYIDMIINHVPENGKIVEIGVWL
jgi:hypothetical protein